MGITLILLVAAAIIFVEVKVVHKFALLRGINERSWAGGVVISLILGQIVGLVFGLTGVVVGLASVISIVCTDSIYAAKRKMIKESKKGNNTFNDIVTFWSMVFRTMKYVIIVLTVPIWLPAKCWAWFERNRSTPQPVA